MTTTATTRLNDAFAFAAELHADHVRKTSNIPYLSHLMAVASLVMEAGGDEDQVIAGLLHDSIEDQADKLGGADQLRAEIKHRFGERVLKLVEGCTDADVIPKPPWRERKEAYIAHLMEADRDIQLVSLCDKLHNLRCILMDYDSVGDDVWNRFKGGKEGTIWYYHALGEVFACSFESLPIYRQFDRALAQLGQLD